MKRYKLEFTAEQIALIDTALHAYALDIDDCSVDPERETKLYESIHKEISKTYK